MILYHYTCEHGARGITNDRLIKPNPAALLGVPLAWFTDLADPDRWALRLTSEAVLTCDRTEYRVTVERDEWLSPIAHWPVWRRAFLAVPGVPERYRQTAKLIEQATNCRPMHWWVSQIPIPFTILEPTR